MAERDFDKRRLMNSVEAIRIGLYVCSESI